MLELRDIWKTYAGQPLLRGISLRVGPGETLGLLGPSGSGKSTLLRIIAGLEEAEGGQIFWNGEEITRLPPHKRNFGLMFQDYALFPHHDVAANIAFGLRMRGEPREKIVRGVHNALAMVNLRGFNHRRVEDLSGGEQQRVALARTLAPEPRLLMLDEPLSALDRTLREELAGELRRLLQRLQIPSLYVTHDQEEAFTVGTRAALLHEGRIAQIGSAAEMFAHPASVWVAEFLALGNILPARVIKTEPLRLQTLLGEFPAESQNPPPHVGDEGWILLRPAGGTIHRSGKQPSQGIHGTVVDVSPRGNVYRVSMQCGGLGEVHFHSTEAFPAGRSIYWSPATGWFLRG